MIIDELIAALRMKADGANVQDRRLIVGLVDHLLQWIDNDQTVGDLQCSVDRYIGNVWLSTDALHSSIWTLAKKLGDEIKGVGGMTVNERLFAFGLFPRYDSSVTDAQRRAVRSKVDA